MKYFISSVLLAAAVAAAPAQKVERGDIAERAPIAEAFEKTFRTFIGRTEEDVAKFISKGEKVTQETTETAHKWKRDAIDAGDDAEHAIALSKRSLYVRGASAEDDDFWKTEHKNADIKAREAMKLKREASQHAEAANEYHGKYIDVLKRRDAGVSEDEIKRAEEEYTNAQFIANKLKREAEQAAEEASEKYAIVAYALRVRNSPMDIDTFVKREATNAEVAMGKERFAKRELFFANKAARKRERIHKQALELQAEF